MINKNKSFLSIKQSKSSKLSDNIYANLKKCLNDKKLERNSFKVHVFGFPSTMAKVLKPKELSI